MATTTDRLLDAYLAQTPSSARLAQRARQVFPSGITHDSRHLDPYPTAITRALGSRKWDLDGNEYVDYSGGHGALLLGHNHPKVTAAVAEQLERGTHYGACHELEVRWGELVQQLVPSAERVRFTSSGTEATLLALRVARAYTGRKRVLRFLGHFHGWHDHVAFGVTSHFDGTPTPGVLPEVAEAVVLAPPGDIDATSALAEAGDVAAIIIEPTGASWGQVPVVPRFLAQLRELADERRIVLIFDEVISGFRCSPGGAQAYYGVTPDLTTLAKIVAGGLPGGALVGKAELMELLDFSAARRPGGEKIPHQGTFNANPVSAAAGIATLELVASGEPCRQANDYAARLRAGLGEVVADEGLDWVVYGTFSGFHIFTNPTRQKLSAADIEAGNCDPRLLKSVDRGLLTRLRLAMLIHGVEIFSWPGGPTSAVHSPDDLLRTIEAFRKSIHLLRADGALA